MAKDKATQDVVAIKKIRSLNEVQGVRAVDSRYLLLWDGC